ncbi:hypothetical protein FE257_010771 [Aspergillus nanangensis]|uniref:Ornithine aminotransferase n=1 Tax=Aspergillus nanangensis TaxID=2582783 RepID=A0AAD4GX50_ASPNN|nr:hypothetical protein FE257_010771 [Aspergillus nanangensis]
MAVPTPKDELHLTLAVKKLLELESKFTKDVDGKEYIDFIAMFSAVNTGHCHPYIMNKITEQMNKVTLVNLSAHNSSYGPFAQRICNRFGYDKLTALTSGTEAADTACKIARRWGINAKGIPAEKCIILAVGSSYHGLGSAVWGLMNSNPLRSQVYGLDSTSHMNISPSTGELLEYLDLGKMKACIKEHKHNVAAVIMECIHGVSRYLPPPSKDLNDEIAYARGVYNLCRENNILFIADEVRQGAGKTGQFFSFQHLGPEVKPDLVTMGKSITGGFYPQSFVMGIHSVMASVGPYEIASSYAFTPLGIAAASATINVLDDEALIDRGIRLGKLWRETVEAWEHPLVDYVAQIGADSNLILRPGVATTRVAALCMHRGLFVYPSKNGLRISFAMNMPEKILLAGCEILKGCLDDLDRYGEIEGEQTRYGPV